jgi:hypothetical protein
MKKTLKFLIVFLLICLSLGDLFGVNYINAKEKVSNGNSFSIIVKRTGKKPISTGIGDAENNAIWIKYTNGKEVLIVSSKEAKDMKYVIGGIHNVQLSVDGQKIYFMSQAWAVSDSIHVVEIKTKREKYICPGNYLKVIKKGPYKGKLIVLQHRYNDAPNYGSYDHYYIVNNDGKEIKALGEELKNIE